MINKVTAKDEVLKICQAIWSCKNEEQKNGCYNMFETYKKKHGDENVGVTFLEIELARLEQMIKMMEIRRKQMHETQEQLKEAQRKADKENPPQPQGGGQKIPLKVDGHEMKIQKDEKGQHIAKPKTSIASNSKLVYDKDKKKTKVVPINSSKDKKE